LTGPLPANSLNAGGWPGLSRYNAITVGAAATTGSLPTFTSIEGNYIGLNPSGTSLMTDPLTSAEELADRATEVLLEANDSTFGSPLSAGRNVMVVEHLQIDGQRNVVQGNYVGSDRTGTERLEPDSYGQIGGVEITAPTDLFGKVGISNDTVGGTSGTTAGGPCTGPCNLVLPGMQVLSGGNQIAGNYLGTDVTGAHLLWKAGLLVTGDNNVIGGVTGTSPFGSGRTPQSWPCSGACNLIGRGIAVTGNSNRVQGNVLGWNAAGTGQLQNPAGSNWPATSPVTLYQQQDAKATPDGNMIGGVPLGANRILGSVQVDVGVRNSVTFNSATLGFAIDLGGDGPTPNHAPGPSPVSGPNNWQNFPTLTLAAGSSSGVAVTGSLDAPAGGTYIIQLFGNPTCDKGDNRGPATWYLGQFALSTKAAHTLFVHRFSAPTVPKPWYVDATATDQNGDTSEIGNCVQVK
jgi:titin